MDFDTTLSHVQADAHITGTFDDTGEFGDFIIIFGKPRYAGDFVRLLFPLVQDAFGVEIETIREDFLFMGSR